MADDGRNTGFFAKHKAGIVLITGSVLTVVWMYAAESLYQLWGKFTFIPENLRYPVEEFLALNGHHNSPFVFAGGCILALATLAWGLKLNGKLKKWYEYTALVMLIFLLLEILIPCLCSSREHSRRAVCNNYLHKLQQECKSYAIENGGTFPDTVDLSNFKHAIHYYGKGKKYSAPPFVLLEDAEKIHAGDMRHRVYSDGRGENFYPWKK